MTAKHFIKGMILFIPLLLLSCNEEQTITESKCKIICSVDEFEATDLSRTTTDPNNNFLITWASGDVIGIFPREGYQEPFEIPTNQIGNTSASFDGGYWDVKDGLQYNAYYPFDKKNFDSADMKTQIPVSYIGQKQNGTSCNIGAFDYTYSDWKTASGGSVSFDFHHIGAIAVFSLKYPATTTYTKLTLSVDDSLIPLEGTYDLTAEDVSFVADENSYSNSISLELNNCSGVAGETGVFYMMLPPMDLTNNEVTFTLTTSAGTVCTYYIEKKLNINKGKLYKRTGIPMESNVEGTVDGWIESRYSNGIAFVANAGDLSSIISEDEKFSITSLKILGKLNGTDINFIRDMAGRNTNGLLTFLDLSCANIVNGEDNYNDYYQTQSNVIGEFMFNDCIFKTLILPSNIVNIESSAFSGCDALDSISIPNSVLTIGIGAFEGCYSLQSIILPDNLENLGKYAFARCQELKSIKIPDNVTAIGDGTFSFCSSLESISLPSKLTSLGSNAFEMCSSLLEIIIPEGITEIQPNTFLRCGPSLIHLGKNIITIKEHGLTPYNNIRLSASIPPKLEENAIYAEEYDDGNGHFDIDRFLEYYYSLPTLYVPYDSYDAYISSDWNKYFNIEYYFN